MGGGLSTRRHGTIYGGGFQQNRGQFLGSKDHHIGAEYGATVYGNSNICVSAWNG